MDTLEHIIEGQTGEVVANNMNANMDKIYNAVNSTESGKITKPAGGTPGQVLGLNNNNQPVWVDQQGGSSPAVITAINTLSGNQGTMSALHTSDKSSLVAAINELYDKVNPFNVSMSVSYAPNNGNPSYNISVSSTNGTMRNVTIRKSTNGGTAQTITTQPGPTSTVTATTYVSGAVESITCTYTTPSGAQGSKSQTEYIIGFINDTASTFDATTMFEPAGKVGISSSSYSTSRTVLQGQYIWFICQAGKQITSISSGQFDFSFISTPATFDIANGQFKGSYKVYRSTNKLTPSTWNLTINYKNA